VSDPRPASDIRTVLLATLPGNPHRERLFREGPCGAAVPVAVFGNFTGDEDALPRWTSITRAGGWSHWNTWEELPLALVLFHEGQPAEIGLDRWWRVTREVHRWPRHRHPTEWIRGEPATAALDAWEIARIESAFPSDLVGVLGDIVVLDADGEVLDVDSLAVPQVS
jgi:hypothetical protein